MNKPNLVLTKETTADGRIDGLEGNATYFVVRKPTVEMGKEKSKEVVEEIRAFLHEHKVLTEQQMKELNEKYGEPAKARVHEMRGTIEKRFDELAKELEGVVSRLENEMSERGILRKKEEAAAPTAGRPGETPGEMPAGDKN